MLGHFIHNKDNLNKARDEYKSVASELYPDEVYSATDMAYLDKTVTYETVTDLEFLNRVMCEALRLEPAVTVPTASVCLEDMQLGNYNFAKGDLIIPFFYGLHRNESEWQRPHEFIPERFDNANELSLTPEGKKRNPTSFTPFNGGMRICLGKTFAEANLKVVSTYLTQSFDFEFVDPQYQAGELPYAHFFQSEAKPIYVKLT